MIIVMIQKEKKKKRTQTCILYPSLPFLIVVMMIETVKIYDKEEGDNCHDRTERKPKPICPYFDDGGDDEEDEYGG